MRGEEEEGGGEKRSMGRRPPWPNTARETPKTALKGIKRAP